MSNQYQTQGYTVNDAGRRLIVDPITRIEGHMRCEVNIDEQNVITNAVSCGTMFRGLEIILQGRDPRDAWAFVERICGVCTGVHALASVYAIEDAIGIQVPDNANIIRNIMLATLWCHDHLVHFYQLAGMVTAGANLLGLCRQPLFARAVYRPGLASQLVARRFLRGPLVSVSGEKTGERHRT